MKIASIVATISGCGMGKSKSTTMAKVKRSKFRPLPTQERLRELLDYCQETGRLTWHISTNSRVRPGDEFGCLNKRGHRVGNIDGIVYVAHRLIWRWMTGDDPVLEVDHKNTVGSDNWWSNLRLATSSQNNGNISVQRRSLTGLKGVTPRGKKFIVKIARDGRQYYLGMFDTPEEGSTIYMAKAKELFGEFARAA